MSQTPKNDTENDITQFLEEVSGVTPLQQDKIIPSYEKRGIFVPQKIEDAAKIEYVDGISDEFDPFENEQQRYDLNFHHNSVSKKQFNQFKSNHFESELTLDLHGCNRETARQELFEFLEYSRQHDYRYLSILPGHGHGVLRQALNLWLRQISDVLAFAESPQRSGGKGNIRVLLKRNHL